MAKKQLKDLTKKQMQERARRFVNNGLEGITVKDKDGNVLWPKPNGEDGTKNQAPDGGRPTAPASGEPPRTRTPR